MLETRRLSTEAKEVWKETEKIDKDPVKMCEDAENEKIIFDPETLTEDSYKELREEIEKHYGVKNPQDSQVTDKTVSSPPISPSVSTNQSENKMKDVSSEISAVRAVEVESTEISPQQTAIKEELKRGKEIEKGKHNVQNRIGWTGTMISKFMTFGELSIKYISDPWDQINPSNYLNQLSRKLTEKNN